MELKKKIVELFYYLRLVWRVVFLAIIVVLLVGGVAEIVHGRVTDDRQETVDGSLAALLAMVTMLVERVNKLEKKS